MTNLEQWQSRYAGPGYYFGTEPNAFLRREARRFKPRDSVLSIADGEGRNGVWLAERGLDVLSVDFSPLALEKSRALAAERGVALRTEQADLAAWTWPTAAFDGVVAIFIQFAAPEVRTRMFAGMAQALKPGGWLLIQGYRPEQLRYGTGGPKDVENLYTRALLEAAFPGFSSLEIAEYDAEIHEGAGHNGMSALIDLVGRK